MPIVKTGVLKLKYNKGFSMIEILVALVILAIGLLGMATLMMNSLQTNQSAAMRSAATQAAYDLIERMRSNADEMVLESKAYERNLQSIMNMAPGGPPLSFCHTCPAVEVAWYDIHEWAYRLDGDTTFAILPIQPTLPGAWAVIKLEGQVQAQNRLWCIGIFWKDSGGKDIADGTKTVCGENNPRGTNTYYEVKVLL